MVNQQNTWHYGQSNTEQVRSDMDLARETILLSSVLDLESQGTGNGAWQISGSNQFSGLESESFVVLGGVRAVSESSGSRCCPGGNASKASGDLQGKASIDILDSADANLGDSEWVHDDQLVVLDLSTWHHVAKPNQAQGKHQPEQGFNYITQTKKEGLAKRKACQNQRNNRNQVAGKRSFAHSQFNSLEGAK